MKPKDEDLVMTLRSNMGYGIVLELSEDELIEDFGWGAVETELRWQLQ